MNMKYIAGGTITLSTLALAAGLTLFLLSLNPILSLGLLIGSAGLFAMLVLIALAAVIIDYIYRPILAKAIAAEVVEEHGRPIVRVIDEEDVELTNGQKALLNDILTLDLTPVTERVNAVLETANKLHPCPTLSNLKIAYPLGAQDGVATRALDETKADEAFSKKYGKSLGVNGYICQVAKVWAVYTCVYNHIDDLRNTQGYSDYIKLCRMANVIGYLEELKKELERERELRPKISVEAWEALSLKIHPQIIKRPIAAEAEITLDAALKKGDKVEGTADTVPAAGA